MTTKEIAIRENNDCCKELYGTFNDLAHRVTLIEACCDAANTVKNQVEKIKDCCKNSDNIVACCQKIEALQKSVDDLKGCCATIDKIEQEIDALSVCCAELHLTEELLEKMEKHIETLQKHVENVTKQLAVIEKCCANIGGLTKLIASLAGRTKTAEVTLAGQMQQLRDQKANADEIRSDQEERAKEVIELQKCCDRLDSLIADNTKNAAKIKVVMKCCDKVYDIEQTINEHSVDIEAVRKCCKQAEDTKCFDGIEETKKTIGEHGVALTKLKDCCTNVEDIVVCCDKVGSIGSSVKEHDKKIAELQKCCKKIEEINRCFDGLDDLAATVDRNEKSKEKVRDEIQLNAKDTTKQTTDIDSVRKKANDNKDEIAKLKDCCLADDEVNDLRECCDTNKSDISSVRRTVEQNATDEKSNEDRSNELHDQVKQNSKDVEALRKCCNTLNDVRKCCDEETDTIAAVKKTVNKNTTDVATGAEQLGTVKTVEDGVRVELQKLVDCCKDDYPDIAAQKQCCSTNTSDVESVKAVVTENTSDVKNLQTCCKQVANDLTQQTACCSANTDATTDLRNEVDANKTGVAKLKVCCDALESLRKCCDTNTADLETQHKCCSDVSSVIESTVAENKEAKTGISSIESSVVDLQADDKRISNDVAALQVCCDQKRQFKICWWANASNYLKMGNPVQNARAAAQAVFDCGLLYHYKVVIFPFNMVQANVPKNRVGSFRVGDDLPVFYCAFGVNSGNDVMMTVFSSDVFFDDVSIFGGNYNSYNVCGFEDTKTGFSMAVYNEGTSKDIYTTPELFINDLTKYGSKIFIGVIISRGLASKDRVQNIVNAANKANVKIAYTTFYSQRPQFVWRNAKIPSYSQVERLKQFGNESFFVVNIRLPERILI